MTPKKVSEKTRAPIRMNRTKDDSLVVEFERLPHQIETEAAFGDRQDQRADRAHRAAFGRRRNPEKNRAQHQEDQRQRRHQHDDHLLRQSRQEAKAERAVDERDGIGDHDCRRRRPDALIDKVFAEKPDDGVSRGNRDYDRDEQRCDAAAERARLGGQGRDGVRITRGDYRDIPHVHAGQHKAGDQRAFIHVADRAAELIGHDDQHERRRDDLGERPRCGNDAGGNTPVITVTQHDRQRDETHRDYRSGDNARRRGQQRADQHDRIGQTAAHRPEELPDGVEQILRHARSLKDEPHERKERDRQQRIIAHDAENALRQSLQENRRKQPELNADEREDETVGGKSKGDRVAEQHQHDQADEHDRRHVCDHEVGHGRSPGCALISSARL